MSTTTAPVTTRALIPDEDRALTAARLVALTHAPYLAHALLTMRPVAANNLGTFAVDAQWRLYLDPAVLNDWGPQHAGGVLIHEAGHLIREHAARATALGPDRNHLLWNYATDAAINDDLTAAHIPLPANPITPDALGLPTEGIEETYYRLLTTQPTQNHDQSRDGQGDDAGQSEGGCGSGAGDPHAPWELDHDDPTAPAVSDATAQITRRAVAHTVLNTPNAGSTGRGTAPAGLRRWAEQTLAPPTVPWQRILAASIRRAVAYAAGNVDFTYRRPGRRRLPGIITPAMHRPVVTAAVVIDTSASMSTDALTAALAETEGVLRATRVGGRGITLLTCDAATGQPQRIRTARDVALAGGGGTDMRVGITAALAQRPRPDLILVFTDGFTPWPEQPLPARLIIGVIGTPDTAPPTPAWATTVTITT